VREAIVVTRLDAAGSKQLVAYLAPLAQTPSASELEQFLRARLPEYMIPAFFVPIAKLPLSRNGKVDRSALPMPEQSVGDPLLPRDEVERRLKELWENILRVDRIGIHDKFFALGGHSLLAVRLVARIESEFNKRISVATVFQNPTIARLAPYLRSNSEPLPSARSSSLVEIQPNGSQPPLFLVHGVGGGMFWGYSNLARSLGSDQPLLAFQSRGLNGEPEFESIEEMAAHYVRELRSFRPHGPYALGGYCFGGVVAYEMACQLEAAGENVAHLCLINSNPPNSSYTAFRWTPVLAWRFLCNLLSRALLSCRLPPKYRREFLRRNISLVGNRVRRFFGQNSVSGASLDELLDTRNYSEQQQRVWETHVRALAKFRARSFHGCVTLFRSRVHHLFCSFDAACGWSDFAANGVEIRIIPGAHETVMDEPHVSVLARQLRAVLNNANAAVQFHRGRAQNSPPLVTSSLRTENGKTPLLRP